MSENLIRINNRIINLNYIVSVEYGPNKYFGSSLLLIRFTDGINIRFFAEEADQLWALLQGASLGVVLH
ncbi:hypothetical protein NDI44_08575 [Trichocoleus sp. DQ-A3]|uniref:hypothetical protein n=1 Tax=Cyanophyceae TaxID=3028117 RepID=UPI00168558EC|nr:hypothetical protein [Coleofasciculus sp. FACHB-125]MBD1899245.1 hypothetical protein [Coleofasciculus sp. FACHB-125]